MNAPYRPESTHDAPSFKRAQYWQSYVGLRRLFQLNFVLGAILSALLYLPALALGIAAYCVRETVIEAVLIIPALVSGVFMLLYLYRIRDGLRVNDVPRADARVFLPWSVAHYVFVASGCVFLAFHGMWPCVFPGLYCLFALFCSFNLWAFVRKLRERETLSPSTHES
jgi:hypothetical protein